MSRPASNAAICPVFYRTEMIIALHQIEHTSWYKGDLSDVWENQNVHDRVKKTVVSVQGCTTGAKDFEKGSRKAKLA